MIPQSRNQSTLDPPREMSCPANSFRYNGSLCACEPGYFLQANGTCLLFDSSGEKWEMSSGADSTAPTFLTAVLPLDTLKRIAHSQAVLLQATLIALAVWIAFCIAIRFGRVNGGKSIWFRIRWWISRLDTTFATDHWLDDQKIVRKRKTELGGTLSVACWMLFAGLLSALLYEVIAKRSTEVHNVRPVNAPDLLSFVNDMEFNITTISSMSCAHLRGPNTLVIGAPGSVDYRVFPLSNYAKYYCQNTSRGPTVSLKCSNCQIPRRNFYISWQFIDLPNDPAMAVGFQFKLTAKNHGDDRYMGFVSGTLKSDSYSNDIPKTFRGPDLNILNIHLFPQIFNNLHKLKLIQPLFHDFIPGSYFSGTSDLQASLQRPRDGLVNTTLDVSFLSDYIVEVDNMNVIGPVSFLAEAGGLYAVSIAVFLYLLLQCEARIKKLRNEDTVMRDIRSRKRAQRNWDKLRRYVMYTWGPSNMNVESKSRQQHNCLKMDSLCGIGSIHRMKKPSRDDSLRLEINSPSERNSEAVLTTQAKPNAAGCSGNFHGAFSHLEEKNERPHVKGGKPEANDSSISQC